MCISAGTLSAISTGASALGQVAQGIAGNKAAKAEAASIDMQAAQAQEAAKQEAIRIRKSADRSKGAARAQLAASGVDVNSGSAISIEQDIAFGAEQDAMNALLTGERQFAAGTARAAQTRAAGRNGLTGSLLGAASTVGLRGWKNVKVDPLGDLLHSNRSLGD